MRGVSIVIAASLILSGCASVSFKQLQPNGQIAGGRSEGAVYFLPKPYLLVAQLPADESAAGGAEAEGSAAPQPSDSTFTAANGRYTIKLVYLPDRSRPMSMSLQSGLLGSGSLNPTLLNGWMLTDFDAETDNAGLDEILTALPGVLTAVRGPETDDAGGGAPPDAEEGDTDREASPLVLRPGLYDFQYDEVSGRLTRLCAVAFFDVKDGAVRGNC